jgi:hypothetical protein
MSRSLPAKLQCMSAIGSGETLKNIGAHFGFGDSAVVKTSTRLEIRFNSESAIRDKVKEVLRALGRGNAETSAQTDKIT